MEPVIDDAVCVDPTWKDHQLMFTRIVVGTDGSKYSLNAVRAAGQLAKLCGLSELDVVTASRIYSQQELGRIQAELPEEFHDLISPRLEAQDRFIEATRILDPSISIIPHEVQGDPADGILGIADSVKADLIVVGARGIGAIERFMRGSVSTKVAQHSPCNVLIVEHDD
jgi:nucleotide-binding universal stress UspA family protein